MPRAQSERRSARPRLLGAALLTAGVLAVRELARPRPGERAELVDWDAVRARALRASGDTGPVRVVLDAADLGHRYDTMAAELRPWLAEALSEDLPTEPFPNFTVLDRRGW